MKNILFLASLLAFITIKPLYAQIGDLQTINSLSFSDGEAFGNKNEKKAYNMFFEYGLSKKSSFGGTLAASDINPESDKNRYAITNTELFHRYKIASFGKNGITLHNAIKFPGAYDESKTYGLMPKQYDYEIRLLGLHNFKERLVNSVVHDSTPYFLRAEVAYRNRFHNPFNEIRFAFWGGFDLTEKIGVLVQDNITWNIQKAASTNNNRYNDFNLSKDANNLATFSMLYHYSQHTAIQLGYMKRIGGNNPFYDDRAITIGLWNAFK